MPIPQKMRRLLIGGQRPLVAALAQKRIKAIGEMHELLEQALVLLFANGKQDKYKKDLASRFSKPFEQHEDARFFDDLAQHVEAEGAQQEAVYLQWLLGLAERAEIVLRQAFVAGPRSGMQRYKAQSEALSRFHAGLRGGKSAFPELANYYAQQRADRPTVSERKTPCLTPPAPPPIIPPPVPMKTPPQQLSLL